MEMEFHSQPSSHTPCIPSLGLSQAPSEEPCLEWPALSVLLSGLYHPPPHPVQGCPGPRAPGGWHLELWFQCFPCGAPGFLGGIFPHFGMPTLHRVPKNSLLQTTWHLKMAPRETAPG